MIFIIVSAAIISPSFHRNIMYLKVEVSPDIKNNNAVDCYRWYAIPAATFLPNHV